MPSVKLPRKSTDTDMTPFVDIAFLILSFFIMATKFKPPEPVQIKTPGSVSSQDIPDNDAVLVTIDTADRVYFSVLSSKDSNVFYQVIDKVTSLRNMTLSAAEKENFRKTPAIGVPFAKLASFLDVPVEDQPKVPQEGIPVLDSANNELFWWINAVKDVFASNNQKLKYLIKGDGASKYPTFEAVIAAFKRNEEFKVSLVTSLESAPTGSALDLANRKGKIGGK